jgi:hypothetical protein
MKWMRNTPVKLLNKEIDWDTDSVAVKLYTSSLLIVGNEDTWIYESAMTASTELGTGGGYTAGGLAVAGRSMTYTAANSWSTQRANSTAYAVDDVVRPASGNGFLYRCAVAGTSGGSLPTYSTVLGRETTDGTVTWETVGSGIVVMAATDPNWTTATFGPCRFAVFIDTQTGAAATNPIIGYINFGSDKTGGGGNFTINLHSVLRAGHFFIP